MAADLFLIKCFAIPLLVTGVSWVQKKWGQYAAGVINGFPLFSGPVSLFVAIEQGLPFAIDAAIASVAGQIAFFAYSIAYLESARWFGWKTSNLIALFCFCLIFFALTEIQLSLLLSLILGYGGVALYILYLRYQPQKQAVPIKPMPHGLRFRAATALLVTLILTSFAQFLGPKNIGLISMFPVITTVVYSFTHAHSGRANLVEFARGSGLVYFGFVSYFAAVIFVGQYYGISATYISALAIALFCGIASHFLQTKYRITRA